MRYRIPQQRCKLVRDGAHVRLTHREIWGPNEAGPALVDYYRRLALPHERMVALLLSRANEIVSLVRVSEGGLDASAITFGDVLRPVLVAGVDAFVLAHNHPSGNCQPSADDINFTARMCEACDTVGVKLLDHIVVGGDEYTAIIGQAAELIEAAEGKAWTAEEAEGPGVTEEP